MRVPLHILVTLLLAMAILPLRGYASALPAPVADEPPCMMTMSVEMQQEGGCTQPGCDTCSSCTLCGHCAGVVALTSASQGSTYSAAESHLPVVAHIHSTYPPVDSPPPRFL